MFLRALSRPTTPLPCSSIVVCLILLGAPSAHAQAGQGAPAGVKLTPISLTLDDSATVRRFGTRETKPGDEKLGAPGTKAPTPGWTTIVMEDVEGDFPGVWDVFDQEPLSGEDYWGDVTCRSFTGFWSAWCADEGSNADCTTYDNEMSSWMVFGPFSLADAQNARAEFFAWSEVEDDFDGLAFLASIDGTNFNGFSAFADFDWSAFDFDLTSVPTLGDLRGQPNVWLALIFVSDDIVTDGEGVYLDDILIEKQVGTPTACIPSATTLCLNNNRFRVKVDWLTATGTGLGQVVPGGTGDSSNIWFFSPNNWEMLFKVLDGCGFNDHFWVFFAATTDVGFTATVTDTQENKTVVYTNPLGQAANAVTDTSAFATCP